VDELVLHLDAAYSGSSIDSPDQADQSQELTYVDIDTFRESFSSSPTRIGTGTMRPSWEIAPYFAFIGVHFVLRQAQFRSPSQNMAVLAHTHPRISGFSYMLVGNQNSF
jgi:hypothetical protein